VRRGAAANVAHTKENDVDVGCCHMGILSSA
jgi:hypothetical protein